MRAALAFTLNGRDMRGSVAAAVQFKVDVPGTFLLVDHAIFRAFNKGALGMLKVAGEPEFAQHVGLEAVGVGHGRGRRRSLRIARSSSSEAGVCCATWSCG